jgi:hypothetical protein
MDANDVKDAIKGIPSAFKNKYLALLAEEYVSAQPESLDHVALIRLRTLRSSPRFIAPAGRRPVRVGSGASRKLHIVVPNGMNSKIRIAVGPQTVYSCSE